MLVQVHIENRGRSPAFNTLSNMTVVFVPAVAPSDYAEQIISKYFSTPAAVLFANSTPGTIPPSPQQGFVPGTPYLRQELALPPAEAAAVEGEVAEEQSELAAGTETAERESAVETAGAEDVEASATETPSGEVAPEEASAKTPSGEAAANGEEVAGIPEESSTHVDTESEIASEQPESDSPDQEKENHS